MSSDSESSESENETVTVYLIVCEQSGGDFSHYEYITLDEEKAEAKCDELNKEIDNDSDDDSPVDERGCYTVEKITVTNKLHRL